MEKVKDDWAAVLQAMVDNYRAKFPQDTRTEHAIVVSMMEHFVKQGVITKKDGKYVLDAIEHPIKLVGMISGPLMN